MAQLLKCFCGRMSQSSDDKTSTKTITDIACHPVESFFQECGLKSADFLRFRALVELSTGNFDTNTCYIPLRIPQSRGFLFESFWRIAQTVEIPIAGSRQHRKFVELEWVVREQGLMEAHDHPALSMLSGEIECFACKSVFAGDAEVVDAQTIQVTCPNCLNQWSLKIDSPFFRLPKVSLLNDLYFKDPIEFNRCLNQPRILKSDRYFQTEFEERKGGSSLEWIFGEREIFIELPMSKALGFEDFVKSFINFLALRYFQTSPIGNQKTAELHDTEVFRRSEIEQALSGAEIDLIEKNRAPVDDNIWAADGVFEIPTTTLSESESLSLQVFDEAPRREESEVTKKIDFKSRAFGFLRLNSQSRPTAIVSFVAVLALVFAFVGYFNTRDFARASLVSIDRLDSEYGLRPLDLPPAGLAPKSIEDLLVSDQTSERLPSSTGEPKTELSQERSSTEDSTTEVASVPADPVPADEAIEPGAAKPNELQSQRLPSPTELKADEPSQEEIARQAMISMLYRQGAAHLRQSQYLEAIKKFESLIELDPDHLSAHLHLGNAFFHTRRYHEARESFEAARALDKANSQIYRSLGLVHFYSRDFPKAIESFEGYLRLDVSANDRDQIEQLMAQMRSSLESSSSLLR